MSRSTLGRRTSDRPAPTINDMEDPDRKLAPTRPVKHSFTIAGHRTSISLEAAFWDALRTAAVNQQIPLVQLVADIDRDRGGAGLSSAIRVWILDHVCRTGSSQVCERDGLLPETSTDR